MTMKNKAFTMALTAALATSAFVVTAPNAEAKDNVKFKDVDYKADYAKAIDDLVTRGVVSGYADGTFKPFKTVTRSQAAKMLANLLELDTKNVENPEFTDVKESDENYGAIAALTELGVFNGYADGSFHPYAGITRDQMAKIIVNAYDLTAPDNVKLPFKDVLLNSEVYDNVAALYHYNITKGTTANEFGVKNNVTRAHFALFTTRAEQAVKNRIQAKITNDELDTEIVEVMFEETGNELGEEIFSTTSDGENIYFEALAEGAGTVVIGGSTMNDEGEYEVVKQNKYQVVVKKENDKYTITLTPSTEVTPTAVQVAEDVLGFEPKNVQITSLDGKVLEPSMYEYAKISEPEEDFTLYNLVLHSAGAYVATFTDDNGNEKRLGLAVSENNFELFAMQAVEKKSVLVTQDEIAFDVRDVRFEQFTAALANGDIADISLENDGLRITAKETATGIFSVRLTGNTDEERLYVHGFMHSVSGVTTIEYKVLTAEEMAELQELANSLGAGGLGSLGDLGGLGE